MASSDQPSGRRWHKRSVVHEEKFRKLQNVPSDQLIELDGYYVCRQQEFLICTPSRNGTCVYVGLGRDGKEVAVKVMLKDTCEHLAHNESAIFCMLKMVKSPHVVRYLSCVPGPDGNFMFIVLELCEYSLVDYVNRVNMAAHGDNQIPFNPQAIIREILVGLETLHKRGYRDEEMILHCDLKPDNVLVDVQFCIRLADFGVSKKIGQGRTTQHTAGRGNIEWQASESIPIESDDPNYIVVYRRKSDIQVAGMLAYYVLTKGGHPYGRISYERPKNIYDGKPEKYKTEGIKSALNKLDSVNETRVALDALTDPIENDFVSWLLQKNIDDRPFADEALKHPYLLSIEDQFNFLVAMGNEPEVSTNQRCYVVNELNKHSNDYPNGWMDKIHPEIIRQTMASRHPLYNNITSLLRFLRNINEHFTDTRTPPIVRQIIVEPAQYFLDRHRFPILPMLVHRYLRNQAKIVAQGGINEQVWAERPTLKKFC